MALGALCWAIGQALWLDGEPVHRVVWWWASFLVLTIVGERLDFLRLQPSSAASRLAFVAAAAAASSDSGARRSRRMAACGWSRASSRSPRGSGPSTSRGAPCGGGVDALHRGCVAVGLRVARRGRASPPRLASCRGGAVRRRILHVLFVGFVFSMIFGHAPIIFPAVLGVRVTYRPVFYLPLGLLHASLVVRMVGDSLRGSPAAGQRLPERARHRAVLRPRGARRGGTAPAPLRGTRVSAEPARSRRAGLAGRGPALRHAGGQASPMYHQPPGRRQSARGTAREVPPRRPRPAADRRARTSRPPRRRLRQALADTLHLAREAAGLEGLGVLRHAGVVDQELARSLPGDGQVVMDEGRDQLGAAQVVQAAQARLADLDVTEVRGEALVGAGAVPLLEAPDTRARCDRGWPCDVTSRASPCPSRCVRARFYRFVLSLRAVRASTPWRVGLVSRHQEHPDGGDGEAEHGQRGQAFLQERHAGQGPGIR